MNSVLALIAIACLTRTSHAFAQQQQQQQQQQHHITRRQASQYCITPENYNGICVTLSYCPQVANVFQTQPQRFAQRYVIASQRSCGTRSIDGDPVVCCTRPLSRPVQPARQTQPQRNPFFPTSPPPPPSEPFVQPTTPRNPGNPFLNPQKATPSTRRPPSTSPPAPLIENRGTYCRDPVNAEGTCMDLKNCQKLVEELQIKSEDADFKNYLRASHNICPNTMTSICCPSDSQTAAATSSTTRRPYSNEVPRRLPTVAEGCGYSTASFKKIVGGTVSKIGAWPWIALLGYDGDLNGETFKCGGTLVTARHVITAAHCLLRDLSFVRLGEHDLTKTNEAKHVDIKIVRIVPHPQYNKRTGRSDLAVLYLERNVEFTDFISPICMPITATLRSKNYEKFTPFVVGWGKTMEGGVSSSVLQELQVPIHNNEVCRRSYKENRVLLSQDQFDSAVICAGVLAGGKDTCQGDSGGPLMIPEPYQNSVRYYLLGVVSYGLGCARPNIPGVYTSMQYFMDWIIEKIADSP